MRDIRPDAAELARRDPEGTLYRSIPDDCCTIRKVAPLARAMVPFAAPVTAAEEVLLLTKPALYPTSAPTLFGPLMPPPASVTFCTTPPMATCANRPSKLVV